jgi:hypothetical protein
MLDDYEVGFGEAGDQRVRCNVIRVEDIMAGRDQQELDLGGPPQRARAAAATQYLCVSFGAMPHGTVAGARSASYRARTNLGKGNPS